MRFKIVFIIFAITLAVVFAVNYVYGDEDSTKNVLKQGLLGAGTGAIASGASGGNAGTGALIGAGTGVIGGALLDAITAPPSRPAPARAARRAPAQSQSQYYDDEESDDEVYYEEPPPQESGTQKVLKQGLLGAGTGAIAAGASGGSAGKGALIGAGTGVIGGALLDAISTPSQPQPRRVYRKPAPRQAPPQQTVKTQSYDESSGTAEGTRKKIIRKYDDTGKVVSEEELYY